VILHRRLLAIVRDDKKQLSFATLSGVKRTLLLTGDEARQMAANIAQLPELLRQFRPLPNFPAKL
ncbi:MAG TPA: hypothetical protein VGU64_05240, partial [Terriglobales bacterium]|nr:hypothetical protein [Terriglobales bacterium]